VDNGAAGPAVTDDTATPGADTLSPADALKGVARAAAENNPTDCSASVAEVARAFEIGDLDDLGANQQIAYMRQNWSEVTANEAQNLANHGHLIVATKPGEFIPDGKGGTLTDNRGNKVQARGQVAVVVPGDLDQGRYPIVAGGAGAPVKDAQTGAISLVRGPSYSAEGHSLVKAFKRADLPLVRYYTPEGSSGDNAPQ
jgi:hypothetical protein